MSRREIDVWPAVSDLMSTIAVLGLVFAAVMSHRLSNQSEENAALRAENLKLSTMQRAVGIADEAMQEVARALEIERQEDLSIVFGENIVSFSTNEVDPKPTPEGRQAIERFCHALRDALSRQDRASFAVLQVEGHTDSTHCPKEPGCNWRYSAERAARFRALLADPALCPGSDAWTIRPVGLADSVPRATPAESRRIELRLVPDYGAILRHAGELP